MRKLGKKLELSLQFTAMVTASSRGPEECKCASVHNLRSRDPGLTSEDRPEKRETKSEDV